MLTTLDLSNFKPLNGLHSLKLAPLTVLAGLNSSGKSSVLQALLAIAQTLESTASNRPFSLNGKLTQLGTFDSVRNDRSNTDEIGLGFTLDLNETTTTRQRIYNSQDAFLYPYYYYGEFITRYRFGGTFVPAVSERKSAIEGSRLSLRSAQVRLTHKTQAGTGAASREIVANVELVDTSLFGKSVVEDDPLATQMLSQSKIYTIRIDETEPLALQLFHFLPDRMFRRFTKLDRLKLAMRAFLADEQDIRVSAFLSKGGRLHKHRFSDGFKSDVAELIKKYELKNVEVASVSGLRTLYDTKVLRTKRKSTFRDHLVDLVVREMFPAQSGTELGLELDSTYESELLRRGTQLVTGFFARNLRYVGPLRVDASTPPSFSGGEADDVGSKGQHAAAVFDANRQQTVEYEHPETGSLTSASLEAALDFWAAYVGIGHHLTASESHPSGMAWRVQTRPGSADRPLQSVGVGVSQLLPVLVAGLLAPKGSTLLLEQPELHLHPRAQAKLAHFLVALANSSRQCIVETHSEYLVNELRLLRVKRSSLTERVSIVFAEQGPDGATEFRHVGLGAYGGTNDWPDGFFDETSRQEQEITRLSMLRRIEEKKKSDDDEDESNVGLKP